eukprot:gene7491-15331_t
MDALELERMFDDDLDGLSVASDEDGDEFMIRSIDKMTSIVKGNKDYDAFADIDDEWNELMQSTVIASDRLSDIQASVIEGQEEALVSFIKKDPSTMNIDTKAMIEAILLTNNVEKTTPIIEDADERIYRRQEIKELLNLIIESVEQSERIYKSNLKNKTTSSPVKTFHIPITPIKSIIPMDVFSPENNISLQDIMNIPESSKNDNESNASNNKLNWNFERILEDEESRIQDVQAGFDEAQKLLQKESEEAQQMLRLESRRRDERKNRRKEEAFKWKQIVAATRIQARVRGSQQRVLFQSILDLKRQSDAQAKAKATILEEKRRKEEEEKIQRESEEKRRKEEEEKIRRESEEKRRKEEEEKIRRESEEKRRKEEEEKIRRESEEKRRKEEEEKIRRESEEKQRKEGEEKIRRESEEKRRKEEDNAHQSLPLSVLVQQRDKKGLMEVEAAVESSWLSLAQSAIRRSEAVPVFVTEDQMRAKRYLGDNNGNGNGNGNDNRTSLSNSNSSGGNNILEGGGSRDSSHSHKVEDLCPFQSAMSSWRSQAMSYLQHRQLASSSSSSSSSARLDHKVKENGVSDIKITNCTGTGTSRVDLVGDCPESLTTLSLCVEGLPTIGFLDRCINLQTLELNVNKLRDLDGLSSLTALRDLAVTDNILSSIAGLRSLHRLQNIKLDVNQITDLSPLSSLSSLITVTVNTNRIETFPILPSANTLQRLELYHNNITSISEKALSHLCSLTHLDLGRNKLTHIDGSALCHCQLLGHLVLSQNKIERVPSPLRLPFLKVLWLSGNKLVGLHEWSKQEPCSLPDSNDNYNSNGNSNCNDIDGGVDVWPVFLPMLEKFYLQDNSIESIPLTTFFTTPNLLEVDLSFNRIPAAKDLCGLQACKKLRKIQVQDNPVYGDAALVPWLLRSCGGLTEVSGKTLSRSVLRNARRHHSDSNSNYDSSSIEDAFAHFTSSGSWRDGIGMGGEEEDGERVVGGMGNNITTSEMTSADSNGTTAVPVAAVSTMVQAHILDVEDYPPDVSPVLSIATCGILHLISHMSSEQNVVRLLLKEREREKDGKMSSTATSSLTTDSSRNIETESILDVLQRQYEILCQYKSEKQGPDPGPGLTNVSISLIRLGVPSQPNDITSGGVRAITSTSHIMSLSPRAVNMMQTTTTTTTSSAIRTGSSQHQATGNGNGTGNVRRIDNHAGRNPSGRMEESSSFSSSASVPVQLGTDNETDNDTDTVFAAIRVQSVFRGVHVRRKLKSALFSARYVDDELDELLGYGNGHGHGDLYEELGMGDMGLGLDEGPAELAAGWLAIRSGGVTSTSSSSSSSLSMVYGDHRRKRDVARAIAATPPDHSHTNPSTYGGHLVLEPPIGRSALTYQHTPGSGSDRRQYMHRLSTPDSEAATEYEYDYSGDASPGPQQGRGHSSGSSVHISLTGSPSTSLTPPASSSSRADSDPGYGGGGGVHGSIRPSRAVQEAQLAEEWGISDPTVIAAMMKRNRRLKDFTEAKEKREIMKDPVARLQKFVKGASTTTVQSQHKASSSSSTVSTSGSFGGKPRTMRVSRGGGNGHGHGHGQSRSVVPAAWMAESK